MDAQPRGDGASDLRDLYELARLERAKVGAKPRPSCPPEAEMMQLTVHDPSI
jgi:hypothetical protein